MHRFIKPFGDTDSLNLLGSLNEKPVPATFRFLFKKSCTSYAHGLNVLIKILGPEDQALNSPQGGLVSVKGAKVPKVSVCYLIL